ncbi:cdc45p [Saccharomyces arboricola H-6]|uniref:Cdc45p n=1 Tax=Saccharomyces arboricola (strain H-6 / AS 2.3317 / CBS 10644) TaxID=1160507 RepID=J8PZF0_SACAR|nr:cdc45p [Saccharomyces arboricola H-6]
MYYGISQFSEAYNRILKNSSSHSSCQLVIFVSCLNIDALCATKMLSLLFKKQLVQSQIVPIFGYSELRRHYSQLDDNINSLLLVGFGGVIDLEAFLEIDPDEYVINTDEKSGEKSFKRDIYVLDAHRPWNLDNIFGSQIIQCFDDGTVDDTLGEQKEAYFKLLELDQNSDKDELSDNDDDDGGEGEATDVDEATDEDEDDDEDEKGEGNTTKSNKRRNSSASSNGLSKRKQRKKQIHKYEDVLQEYYSQGTTVVNSISAQIYSLLSAIGETNLSNLWLNILGTTSLDIAYAQVYNRLYPLLQDEVKRLTPSNRNSVKTPDTLSLRIQPDYYLFLLRHSSLYDSFYYSNYVNAKLSLWNENGKKRLHKMFARMGIPLSTAQETWLYMDHSIKRELGLIFDKNLDRYGLQDIIRDGFVRTLGYRGSISASEFVEALTALLEVGNATDKDNVKINKNNDEDTDGEDEEGDNVQKLTNLRKRWVSNFWLSWDALDDEKMELLNRGINMAQDLQRAVFNTGVTILEKKLIKHLRIYRLCVLQDGPDLDLYRNPLTLLRLGNWLIECCAESEDKQLLPMVLASVDENTDTYLVAGLTPRYPRGLDTMHTKKPILNNFSMAFQQITAETDAKVRIDNFESSIIEIRREDLSPFLEKLTLSGLL